MAAASRCVLVWLCLLAGALPALPLPAAGETPGTAASEDPGHPVLLDREEAFRLHGGAIESFTMEDRVRIAEERLRRIAQDPFYAPGLLEAERDEEGVWIRYRGKAVGLVDDAAGARLGISAERRAAQIIQAIERAVARYRERRQPEEWARAALLLLATTLVFAGAIALLTRLHRRLAAAVRDRGARLRLGGQRVGSRSAARITELQLRGLRALGLLVGAVLLLAYFQVAFTIVPLTRGFAFSVLDYLVDPLRVVWEGFLGHVGDIFFIAVVVLLARLLLRGLRALLTEAAVGAIQLPGTPRDRALPLYKILRLVIIAVTVVMIYPYIPGSSSAAFQGISLFAGALFTLGASSTASNFIGGMVLVFSGAFQIGDRVRIADTTGDVEESTLALTRLRTPCNELVTFANSTVLSQGFVNYSAMARREGVVVHSGITIGYNVPWRKVHELLLEAARRTEGLVEQPAPFVLQTALNDSHVGYRVHAYTRNANAMPRTLSGLHENIQDVFAEGGVEILSPAYSALRDGAAPAVPATSVDEAGEPHAEEADPALGEAWKGRDAALSTRA